MAVSSCPRHDSVLPVANSGAQYQPISHSWAELSSKTPHTRLCPQLCPDFQVRWRSFGLSVSQFPQLRNGAKMTRAPHKGVVGAAPPTLGLWSGASWFLDGSLQRPNQHHSHPVRGQDYGFKATCALPHPSLGNSASVHKMEIR